MVVRAYLGRALAHDHMRSITGQDDPFEMPSFDRVVREAGNAGQAHGQREEVN